MKWAVLGMIVAIVSGCAKSSSDISTTYVSPLLYQNLSCEQLALEGQRVSVRAAQLGGHLDEQSTQDAVATGVGVVLFWPALFFIDGNGPEAAEYGRLKGEREAIEQAAIQKNCNLRFDEQPAE